METYLAEFIAVAVLHLLAVMSPGPDFIMISRNSLVYSRRVGVYSSIGLAIGILVHVTYSLVGIGFIISQSIVVFSIIKLLGAGYLIYIGYKSLTTKSKQVLEQNLSGQSEMGWLAATKNGFLTNVLNPKASLFFLAVFSQVIHETTPTFVKLLYGLEMSLMTFVWFAFVSIVLSHKTVKKPFIKIQHHLERVMGVILVALGIRVALSK